MAINNTKKDSGQSSSEVAINFCSVNIGGKSDRSGFTLDKYCHDKNIDILAIQESLTVAKTNLNVNSMDYITDTNNSLNRGASIYVNSQKFSINQLPQVSKVSRNLDTAWGHVCGKGFKYVVGSVYLKLTHKEAVNELIKILESAKKQASQLKAKGIIVFGDYKARNGLWGNQIDNQYSEELANKLDFQEYSIISSEVPTFLSSNGNSNIDFLIRSNNLEPLFSILLTDPVVELLSGAPNSGHVPISTSMKITSSGTQNQPPKLRIDLDRMDWEGWSEFIESSLENDSFDFYNSSTQDQWKIIDRTINEATLKFSKCKKLSTHCKPYWTKEPTESSKALSIAKKSYLKRNTFSNKAIMDLAKEKFDSMRISQCQKFILYRTRNLNVAQCKQF